jgi:transposase-like protein
MSRKRNHYTGEMKVAILRKHLIEGVPVSDICRDNGIKPKMFYDWQKIFFENGAAAFQRSNGRSEQQYKDRIETLEQKLSRKHEVLSELMEEHVALKKSLGEI